METVRIRTEVKGSDGYGPFRQKSVSKLDVDDGSVKSGGIFQRCSRVFMQLIFYQLRVL